MVLWPFSHRQDDNKYIYDSYLTYVIRCAENNLANCKNVLDIMKKEHTKDIFIHNPVRSDDPTVKKADYIVEVADNQRIRTEFEDKLRSVIESFEIF